jgi:hypothetical protein
MNKKTKNKIMMAFMLIMMLGSSFTYALISAIPSESTANGQWVAKIIINVNEEQQTIPADIGYLSNSSVDKVYTLSTDGIIYKNTDADVTVKDFFDVWNQTFNSTCILDSCIIDNTTSIVMYVSKDGSNWVKNDQMENYVIQNRDVILIDYR